MTKTVGKNSQEPIRPLLCLAASGGGHFRQLLDLEPLWRDYPHYFITEDTALGRSFDKGDNMIFVPHFAIGQMRRGKKRAMVKAAWFSLRLSARIMLHRRPDVVITTGAGSQLFVLIWARLLGARIYLIDSFARFERPSKFAKLAGIFAHVRIAQSEMVARNWYGARAFDPLEIEYVEAPAKEDLVFATVGATLPFERLTSIVVEAKKSGLITGQVVLQTGETANPPAPFPGLEVVEGIPFEDLRKLLQRASLVVCHGGTGSLITALAAQCRVIAIPRSAALGEHYDDHQSEITDNFQRRGLIETAHDVASFAEALERVKKLPLVKIRMNHERLIAFLRTEIDALTLRAPHLPRK